MVLTPENASKTPTPYLGLAMGLGTPALMIIWAGAGWKVALAVLVALTLLAIPFFLRFDRKEMVRAYGSEALMRYNIHFMIAVLGYVVGLIIAVSIHNSAMALGTLAYAVPLLPTLPALAMIFVMGRYLVEETDEYLRHRASLSAIVGLGVVLVLGTVWGFLETFGLVPHVWAWWVVPAWAIGLGIGQGLLSRSERKSEDASAEDASAEDAA